jgi:hypothetical protein
MALGPRGPDDGPSLGLAILRRQGVAAWLCAWATCPRPSAPVARPASPRGIPSLVHSGRSSVVGLTVTKTLFMMGTPPVTTPGIHGLIGKQYMIGAVNGGNYCGEYIAYDLPDDARPN